MNLFLRARTGYSLKIDGELKGAFAGDVKIAELAAPSLIELLPHRGGESVCFLADGNLKNADNFNVYKISDGYFVDVFFGKNNKKGFKVLFQKRFGEALITIYRDRETRVVAETKSSAEVCVLPVCPESFGARLDGKVLYVYSTTPPHCVCAFSLERGVKKVMENIFDEIEFSPVFRTKTRLFDIENTVAEVEWKYSAGEMRAEKKKLEKGASDERIKTDFFKQRIFFERVLKGLPVSDMLSEGMREKEKYLSEYLGKALSVLPCYCSDGGVCLSYAGKDCFSVKVFSISFENGLISNLVERCCHRG